MPFTADTALASLYRISPLTSVNSEERYSNFFTLLCEAFFFTSAFAENFNCSDGGGKRDRTADLLHAMQALSQLSYTPLQNRNEILEANFRFVNTL